MSRAKHWAFTLNNYSDQNLLKVANLWKDTNELEYLIYGKETAESGTPHLQGFVSFRSRKRLNQVRSLLGQAHYSIARSISQSIEYCKKEGDVTEYGISPTERQTNAGGYKRVDLNEFKESVKSGGITMKVAREMHSQTVAKYPKFCENYILDNKETYKVPSFPLRKWQSDLNAILNRPPDTRSIIFLIDYNGNAGKTWFMHYYSQNHDEETCQVIIPGKKADMAFALIENPRVVMFDCPRSKQGEYLQYDFLEEVKNGYVFSPKYNSRTKRFAPPHVVVCMNEDPDMSKLSNDRYKIIKIDNNN